MRDIVERIRRAADVGEAENGPSIWINLQREAAAEIERLREENVDLWRTFDTMWNANMRAIKRWHAAGNPENVWPDHADMVVWLLERLSEAEAQCKGGGGDRCDAT